MNVVGISVVIVCIVCMSVVVAVVSWELDNVLKRSYNRTKGMLTLNNLNSWTIKFIRSESMSNLPFLPVAQQYWHKWFDDDNVRLRSLLCVFISKFIWNLSNYGFCVNNSQYYHYVILFNVKTKQKVKFKLYNKQKKNQMPLKYNLWVVNISITMERNCIDLN